MSEVIAKINDAVIAINIAGSYRHGMSATALYHSTRGTWRVSRLRAEKARYAFSVFRNVILEVYEIHQWHDAGSTEHSFGPAPGRSEFTGSVARDEVRDKYRGKRLPDRSWGNPISYYNC